MKRSTGGSLKPPTALIALAARALRLERRRGSRRGSRPAPRGRGAPGRSAGLPFRNAWSTSTIAKLVSGNRLAVAAIASPCAKPTPMIRSIALPRERRHVRDVVGGGLRLDDAALDPELALGALEPLEGELVEAVVVELARVGDQPDLEARRRRRLPSCRRRLVVAAAPCRERGAEDGERRERGEPERDPLHLVIVRCSVSASFCL